VTETARSDANLFMEWNVSSLGGTNEDLDALGRTDAEPDFAVLRFEGQQTAFLEPLFAARGTRATTLAHEMRAAVNVQWAFDNRLVPNQMQTQGGLYTVRGYPQSVVAGDSGVFGTLEYRYHVARGLSPRPEPGSMMGRPFRFRPQYAFGPTDWNLLLKAFVDAGRAENSDRREFEVDQTLLGAGIGAELAWTRRFNLRADLGFALRELEDADGASVVDAGHAELYIVLTLIY
jgi:hemolysin activation/secretion protein